MKFAYVICSRDGGGSGGGGGGGSGGDVKDSQLGSRGFASLISLGLVCLALASVTSAAAAPPLSDQQAAAREEAGTPPADFSSAAFASSRSSEVAGLRALLTAFEAARGGGRFVPTSKRGGGGIDGMNVMDCGQRCENFEIQVFKGHWRRRHSNMHFIDFLRDLVVFSAYYPELREFKPLVDRAVQNYEMCRYITCSTDYLG